MVVAETVASWIGIAVGAITILASVKSAYNGYIRAIVRGLLKVDRLCREVEEMYRRQQDLTDAVVAVTYAGQRDDVQMISPGEMKREFDKDEGPGRFIKNDGQFIRGGSEDD